MIRPPNPALMRPQAVSFGLTPAMLTKGLEHVYETVDAIDVTMLAKGGVRLSNIVELANLSSILGNILAQGIVNASTGTFSRAGAHKYQDLRATVDGASHIEIKMALEGNQPKAHLAKAGHYLTARYVLCGDEGSFKRGDANRGGVPRIWELRLGKLDLNHFNISNTVGDSGKTAVVNSQGMKTLSLVYFDHQLSPKANVERYLRDYGA